MYRFVLRTMLTALAFAFVLPLIHGIDFHGNFGIAVVAALVFGLVGWIVDALAISLSAVLTITTLGLALLVLVPLWVLGFWILPAVALHMVAGLMPTHLTVEGWVPAIEGGLIMLLIGIITSKEARPRRFA